MNVWVFSVINVVTACIYVFTAFSNTLSILQPIFPLIVIIMSLKLLLQKDELNGILYLMAVGGLGVVSVLLWLKAYLDFLF